MGKWSDLLLYLWAAAVAQNMILTTGFGTSTLLLSPWRSRQIWRLFACMTVFCLLTSLSVFPLWQIPDEQQRLQFWRPLILIGVDAVWYVAAVLLLRKAAPGFYGRWQRALMLGAFNNVIVGVLLLANHQFEVGLLGLIGLSVGACVGFLLLSLLTAEGVRRMDHPDMPAAFRGLPAALLYLGILAMTLVGFSSPVSFV